MSKLLYCLIFSTLLYCVNYFIFALVSIIIIQQYNNYIALCNYFKRTTKRNKHFMSIHAEHSNDPMYNRSQLLFYVRS